MRNDPYNWRKTLANLLRVHDLYQHLKDQTYPFLNAVVKPHSRRLTVSIQECRKRLGDMDNHREAS